MALTVPGRPLYELAWPLTETQVEGVNQMFEVLFGALRGLGVDVSALLATKNSAASNTVTAGPRGFPGDDGAEGEPGPSGIVGARGAQGVQGPVGMGLDGIDGIDGADGVPGAPGGPGAPGAQGAAGAVGAPGPMGFDGQDGDDLVWPWPATMPTWGPGTLTITTTGVQNALPIPPGNGPLTIFLLNAALLTVQGIAPGQDGQSLTFRNLGTQQTDLIHEHATPAAAWRVTNNATSGPTSIAPGGAARYVYDASLVAGTPRWRLVQHAQGAWITPAYVAGDFTGSGAMTWTVDVGDRSIMKYLLDGRRLSVAVEVLTTSIAGTPTALLQIAGGQFGGFIFTGGNASSFAIILDNLVTQLGGRFITIAGLSQILIQNGNSAATFSASVNATYAFGTCVGEVL